jgi:hypothetical protein
MNSSDGSVNFGDRPKTDGEMLGSVMENALFGSNREFNRRRVARVLSRPLDAIGGASVHPRQRPTEGAYIGTQLSIVADDLVHAIRAVEGIPLAGEEGFGTANDFPVKGEGLVGILLQQCEQLRLALHRVGLPGIAMSKQELLSASAIKR